MLVFLGTESGGFIYLHILYLYSGKRERPGHEANNKLLSSSFTCRSPSAKLLCLLGLVCEDLPFWAWALRPRGWVSLRSRQKQILHTEGRGRNMLAWQSGKKVRSWQLGSSSG